MGNPQFATVIRLAQKARPSQFARVDWASRSRVGKFNGHQGVIRVAQVPPSVCPRVASRMHVTGPRIQAKTRASSSPAPAAALASSWRSSSPSTRACRCCWAVAKAFHGAGMRDVHSQNLLMDSTRSDVRRSRHMVWLALAGLGPPIWFATPPHSRRLFGEVSGSYRTLLARVRGCRIDPIFALLKHSYDCLWLDLCPM